MAKETFKTMIGGQALIEGIMMRGPQKDAIVVRTADGLNVELSDRKIRPKSSPLSWPFLRGPVNFIDAQMVGIKALMHSADLNPDQAENPSKFDLWLEKKLNNEKNKNLFYGILVAVSLLFSVGLFFVLPMLIGLVFEIWTDNLLTLNLLEGLVRVIILTAYMIFASRMEEMKRLFAYHGAEHKTIRCYEARLPLTVENVRVQTRMHPRCGTSFLLVVMILSILVFTVAVSVLLEVFPALAALEGTFLFRLIKIVFKLLLLPLVVAIAYEINRWVGRHDNAFSRILTAPGLWMQNFTTNEPDDGMIEVAIAAVKAVLPEQEGADAW